MATSKITWALGAIASTYLLLIGIVATNGPTKLDYVYNLSFQSPLYPLLFTVAAILLLAIYHAPLLKGPPTSIYNKIYPATITILLLALAVSLCLLIGSLSGSVDISIPIAVHTGSITKLVFMVVLLVLAIAATETWRRFPSPKEKVVQSFFFKVPAIALLVVIFGVGLRVWGIGHGVNHMIFHPDAPKQILAVQEFKKGHYTFDIDDHLSDPMLAGYPFFAMHLTRFGFEVYEIIKKFAGFNESGGYGYGENQRIVLTSRWLNVLYSIIIILVVYRTGAIFGGEMTGYFASLLAAVSISHLQMSKYLCADIPMSMFAALAVYCATLNLQAETRRNYLLFGLFAGLATASKYNGSLIYLYLGLVYLFNHRLPAIFINNFGKLVLAVSVGALVFFLTHADFLTDPARTLFAIKQTMTLSANTWVEDGLTSTRIKVLIDNFWYHKWTFLGLFQPIPLWLVAASTIMAIYTRGLRILAPIVALLAIFAYGKWSMPVSATHHYYNIWPLAILIIAVGISDFLGKLGKSISITLAMAISVFLSYQAIQDTSIWAIPDRNEEFMTWMSENLNITNSIKEDVGVLHAARPNNSEDLQNGMLVDFYHGSEDQAISLHRDGHIYMFVNNAKNHLYPPVNFISHDKWGIIYSQFGDMVVTKRAITTNWEGTPQQASRLVYAKGGLEKLAVWISNNSREQNKVELLVGGRRFEFSLGPEEEAPLVMVDNPSPSMLYRRNFIPVSVESEKPAHWIIATDKSHIADLLLYKGKKNDALKLYKESNDLYGLFRAAPLVDKVTDGKELVVAINKINPNALTAEVNDTDTDFWERVSGYKSRLFDGKLYRSIKHEERWASKAKRSVMKVNGEESYSWDIEEDGILYGPYISLLRGDYILETEIIVEPGFKSMVVDVASEWGAEQMGESMIAVSEMDSNGSYNLKLPFHVSKPISGMIEFRFSKIIGGGVVIKNPKVRADFLRSTNRLITHAKQLAK